MYYETYEIGNPQIVTTEYGAALVEKHAEGFFTATIGEYSRAGKTPEEALAFARQVQKTIRQFSYGFNF